MADEFSGASDAVDDLTTRMTNLDQVTVQFGRSLSRAMASGIVQGKSFDDILQGLGQKLIEISLRAALRPLETGLSGIFNGLLGGLTGAFSGASGLTGDLFAGAGTFANQNAPMPAASGITVNMAVSSPDAESFRRSEGQISAALARAVMRGQRNL